LIIAIFEANLEIIMTHWAVDSHVHFHDCFNEGLFFDSCLMNLSLIPYPVIKDGILFFTEGRNEDSFNYLRSIKEIKNPLSEEIFILRDIQKGNALELSSEKRGIRVIIFPGFQIVTKDNLEVLSLGTKKRLADGSTTENTITDIISLDGVPVLPWGFGKWFGSRGYKINQLIRKRIPHLFLGDNGGRSSILPFPNQFNLAENNDMKILPGSDPLPFPQEARRPMSYGFVSAFNFDESNPWESIKRSLLAEGFKFEKFGDLTSPLAFIRTQIAMQIKKRKSK
jgi:hypothetical protein